MILYNVLLTYDLFVTDGSEGGGGGGGGGNKSGI